MKADPRTVITGAGPTGLGAGYRRQEPGYDELVDKLMGDGIR